MNPWDDSLSEDLYVNSYFDKVDAQFKGKCLKNLICPNIHFEVIET